MNYRMIACFDFFIKICLVYTSIYSHISKASLSSLNYRLTSFNSSRTMWFLERFRKWRVFLVVVFLFSFAFLCQGRVLLPSPMPNRDSVNRAFVHSAEQVMNGITRRHQSIGQHYKPNRLSPGGPNPHHH